MAKNLKLSIKNNQLAQVLKQKKQKPKPTKKASDEASSKSAEPKKQAITKARKPQKLVKKVEVEKEPPKEVVEPVIEEVLPKKEEPKETIEAKETPPPEVPEQSEKLGTIRPPKEKPKKPPAEVAKKENATRAVHDKKSPYKGKSSHEQKSLKEPKSTKRQAFGGRTFNSQHRQGIRTQEEEAWRRRRHHRKPQRKSNEPIIRPTEVTVKLPISVKELAATMKYKSSEVIQKLFLQGLPVTINDYLDDETVIQLIGHELNCEIKIDYSEEEKLRISEKSVLEEVAETDEKLLQLRAPIVTFMGHVDHGKTSLIDAIRNSNLASGEAGAITQHIGAFRCHTDHGDITILDTPGHEAFTAIRSRGALATDIVVLVIAGDEGMKPQTEEAIDQAKEAGVPMIVAINKCDKPAFNAENVYRQLADKEMLPEAWGGDIITVNCSASTKEGIDSLVEMLALQSEILELKANPSTRARGVVLESELHKGLGSTATLLVQNGTLKKGDALIFEQVYGRVKTMKNEHNKLLKEAKPSCAVEVTGLSGVPDAGQEFVVVESEREAKKIAEARLAEHKQKQLRQGKTATLEDLFKEKAETQEQKVLNILIKADVQGSIEALATSLMKIKSNKARVNILKSDVGQISESDVELAAASNAVILGFHTNVEYHAEELIKRTKVKIKLNDIIYHLVDEVKKLMTELLDKVRQETEVGSAEIRAIFKSSQLGLIAGCQVLDGTLKRSSFAKLFRENEQLWEGEISSIKRLQDDVKEVTKGLECGILLQGFRDYKEGDIIKAYDVNYLEQEL